MLTIGPVAESFEANLEQAETGSTYYDSAAGRMITEPQVTRLLREHGVTRGEMEKEEVEDLNKMAPPFRGRRSAQAVLNWLGY